MACTGRWNNEMAAAYTLLLLNAGDDVCKKTKILQKLDELESIQTSFETELPWQPKAESKEDKNEKMPSKKLYSPCSTRSGEPDGADDSGMVLDREVRIGRGKTKISKKAFNKINWKSYNKATRTLSLAVFGQNVLATHSLTGQKSPAFCNKPAKRGLDPEKVEDIILEVQKKFEVERRIIRGIITTKCADECKMMRKKCGSTLID